MCMPSSRESGFQGRSGWSFTYKHKKCQEEPKKIFKEMKKQIVPGDVSYVTAAIEG